MLGEAIYRLFHSQHELKCTDIDLNSPWLEFCDFRDFAAYKDSVESFQPDILMHIGAHTDLEYCENNPHEAYRTNTLAVEHAAHLAAEHNIILVYISTAGIFDGTKLCYDDWDTPNPLGVYGRSKYLGETIVQQRVPRHFICRAGWMMGGGPGKDKKFIAKIMAQLATGTRSLNIVEDKLGTPTYTIDFAYNLRAMIATVHYGLYNMVCDGETSRLEVARELLKLLRLENQVHIHPVKSDFFASQFFAPRPASERLVNYKLNLRGLNLMRNWRDALYDYISDYYFDYLMPFAPDFVRGPRCLPSEE